jgi:hypothetical protein
MLKTTNIEKLGADQQVEVVGQPIKVAKLQSTCGFFQGQVRKSSGCASMARSGEKKYPNMSQNKRYYGD